MDTAHAVGCAALRESTAHCSCQRPLTRSIKCLEDEKLNVSTLSGSNENSLDIKRELLALQASMLRLYKRLPPFHPVGMDLTEMLSLMDYAMSHGIQGGKKR